MIIEKIIEVNKNACENIASIENAIQNMKTSDEKSKVNFGNLCIALHGFRMIANATEAMLINEDVLKNDDGEFYQKVKLDKTINPDKKVKDIPNE